MFIPSKSFIKNFLTYNLCLKLCSCNDIYLYQCMLSKRRQRVRNTTPKKYCWDFLRNFDQSTDTFNNAMFVLCIQC